MATDKSKGAPARVQASPSPTTDKRRTVVGAAANVVRLVPRTKEIDATAWPFPMVDRKAYWNLPAPDRIFIQGVMSNAIAQRELASGETTRRVMHPARIYAFPLALHIATSCALPSFEGSAAVIDIFQRRGLF